MAGQLKRENPDIQEDLVLIRALRDSNLPKFLADDAILFKVSVDETKCNIHVRMYMYINKTPTTGMLKRQHNTTERRGNMP